MQQNLLFIAVNLSEQRLQSAINVNVTSLA